MASISTLLKIIGLFCKIDLSKRLDILQKRPICSSLCYSLTYLGMWWLRIVGSLKSQVSFVKETYKRDDILQKRPACSPLRSSLTCHDMGWLRLVGSLKSQVSFANEPYKRDYILQKRPIILRSLLIVATPYQYSGKA